MVPQREFVTSSPHQLPLTIAALDRWSEDQLLVHGVQLYVSVGGELVAELAIGEARPGVPMASHSICRQSCTAKPVTAIAIAALVSQKLVSFDDPVRRFIPRFVGLGKEQIQVRHLLNHTAGLHCSGNLPRVPSSEAEVLEYAHVVPLPPGWRVGVHAAYSPLLGWQLLGEIIETVTGQPVREFLRNELFLPLGMADSWIGMSPGDYRRIQERLALNHHSLDPSGQLLPLWVDLAESTCTFSIPANGGYMPARDLGRLYEALLSPEEVLSHSISLAPSVAVSLMAPQRPRSYDLSLMRVCDYGFGFMINLRDHYFGEYCTSTSFGHSGAHGASLAFADPEHQLVVAVIFTDIIDWQTSFVRRTSTINSIYRDLGLSMKREAARDGMSDRRLPRLRQRRRKDEQ